MSDVKTARVDAVEFSDANGEAVLHLLFEDGAQQVLSKKTKAKLYDSSTDDDVPVRLQRDGHPIHEYAGKPVQRPFKAADVGTPVTTK